MTNRFASLLVIGAVVCLVLPAVTQAQDFAVTKEEIKAGKKQYSPHLHQLSQPCFLGRYPSPHLLFHRRRYGGNTLGPDEALRFAKGEQVISSTGVPARLMVHQI